MSGVDGVTEVRIDSNTVFSPVRMCGRRGVSCGSRYNVRKCGTIFSTVRLARVAERQVKDVPVEEKKPTGSLDESVYNFQSWPSLALLRFLQSLDAVLEH